MRSASIRELPYASSLIEALARLSKGRMAEATNLNPKMGGSP